MSRICELLGASHLRLRSKEAYAKEHFAALDPGLRNIQEVDVDRAFRDYFRQVLGHVVDKRK